MRVPFFLCLVLTAGASASTRLAVVAHTSNSLTIEATLEATPGAVVPLGLVAAPEGTAVRGAVVDQSAAGVAMAVTTGDAAMIRELRVVPLWLSLPGDVAPGEVDVLIDVRLEGLPDGRAPFRGYLPASFRSILGPHVLNWDQVRLEDRSPGVRYLIVTTDALAASLGPLVDWKERKGLAPQLVTVSQTGSTPYDIRQYILNLYNTSGTLEYVLLAGDHPALPTYTEFYNPIGGGYLKSDRYFAYLVGGDNLPDVFIGRLPAASTADLELMVSKILDYEAGTGAGPWMGRGVMAAGSQHPSQPETKRTIRDWLLSFGYDEVDTVFAPGQTAVQLMQKLAEGRSLVNYRGGVADPERWAEIGWTQDYCYYTENGYKRPLVTSIICLTGNLTYTGGIYGECLGESFMRAPGGAIAFFGASQITHTYANNTLDLGIYDALTHQGVTRMGPITDAGLFYLYYNYPPSDTVTVLLRQYNLFGDPELALWTREPSAMSVSHPSTVPAGTSNVTVSTGVGGSLVCLRGAGVYEAAYADGSGNAYLQVSPSGQGAIDVTVTNPGFYPYQGQISVAATYSIGGTVSNEAGAAMAGVTVTLAGSSTGQVTTGSDGGYAFGDLAAGGSYTVTPSYTDIAGAWSFSPQSRTFNDLQGDQWGQDFTGIFPRYTIGGTITSYAGAGMEGVTVSLSGFQQAQTTTNAQGYYQFTNLLGAETYTVTPSYVPAEGAWSFDPPSRTIQLLTSNHWAEDFVGTPPFYAVSGTVRNESGTPMQGVRVVLSGDAADTVFTAADGAYSLQGLAGGFAYTVTPSFTAAEGAWTFSPPSYGFNPLTGSQSGRNFTGIRPRYSISGAVSTRQGQPLEGVRVILSGGMNDSTLTDAGGLYSFGSVPGGLAYTLRPRKAYDDTVAWGFTPEEISVANLVGSLSGQAFTAQLPVILAVGDGMGEPGTEGNAVEIALDSQTYQAVGLDTLCFTLAYSAAHGAHVPAQGGMELLERAEGMLLEYQVDESNPAACSVTVVIRRAAAALPPGSGAICAVLFSLDQGADTAYATALSIPTASAWDTTGFPIPVDHHDTGRFGTGVSAPPAVAPTQLVLHQPVPNPAAGEVTITFSLPRASRAAVVIRDLTGRALAELDQGTLQAGDHRVVWRGDGSNGRLLPNGTYHCQLVACGQSASQLIVLLR